MKGHKLNNTDALKFIFSGKSTTTFLNVETNNRFTFKVKQAKDSNLFFISLLNGPDNYSYIGTAVEGNYRHGKKSLITKDSQSVKVFEYVVKKLKSKNLSEKIEVWHEGRCGKCNRPLTVPSSILTGIGPSCAKKLSKSEKRDNFLKLILA